MGPKLILLEIRADEPDRGIKSRVSVHRCKKWFNPHDGATPPRRLPWALRNSILNMYSKVSPPFHITAEDVTTELETYRVTPCKIAKQWLTRGLLIGGTIAVQYLTYWEHLVRPLWEHEEDLDQYGNHAVRYWVGNPVQDGGGNAKYRRYRVQVAKRATAREKGERHVLNGYNICCDDRERPGFFSPDIARSCIYYYTTNTGL